MANFYAKAFPQQASGGGGVTSLNSETGALSITAGTGIAVTTPTSSTIQIASTSAGDVTLAAFGTTPNSSGASIASQVLTLQPADGTNPGGVSTTTQTFAGAKTFSGDLTLSGNVTYTPTVNNSLTGANARVPSHTTANLVFTNASLTSIGSANNGGISGGHTLYITNATGANLTIINNYGSAAAGEAIITGNNADAIVPNKGTFALQYNATSSCWSFIGAGLTNVASGSVTGVLPVANGGTNSSSALSNNRVMQSSGGAIVEAAAITASRALASDANGIPVASATTATELGYVSGVTSAIQTQLNAKGVGSVTSVAMSVPSFLSVTGTPITGSGTLAVSYSGTALPIANGGTAVTSTPTTASASAFAAWDASVNLPANNFLSGWATQAKSGGTTALTVASKRALWLTGASSENVLMPNTNTLVVGTKFLVYNQSGAGTVNVSNSANSVTLYSGIPLGCGIVFTCISTAVNTGSAWTESWFTGSSLPVALGGTGLSSGTSGGVPYFSATSTMASSGALDNKGIVLGGGAGATPTSLPTDASTTKVLVSGGTNTAPSWSTVASGAVTTATFTAPTIQKFTSGSGTYTTPTSPRTPLYIKVRMVGGGGGGAGSGTSAGTAAGNGGNTTFGSSLLVANGGGAGSYGATGGSGGTGSLGAGPIGTVMSGGAGGAAGKNLAATTGALPAGGNGGSSYYGGAGTGGTNADAGGNPTAGATNTGAGGGGGGATNATSNAGAGGGAGAFVDAIITSPSATYSYAVGGSGTAGGVGGGGAAQAGAAGAAGYIEVTEYYQ